MAPAGLVLALLCAPLGPAGAGSVLCFVGPSGCSEPLLELPVPLADCCLNPSYWYRRRHRGLCRPCRPETWGPWGPWGACSASCGEGTQLRGRGRRREAHGDDREWQRRVCDLPCCPEAGAWAPWGPWAPCSVTCGSGSQWRERSCPDPAPRCGGGCGAGDARETRMCAAALVTCPVGGSWGPWGPWGGCSRSCRSSGAPEPERTRSRRCDSPPPSVEPPGAPCRGGDTEREPCPGLPPCPVDGAWGPWGPASPCPVTCGLGAVTWRRACDSPAPRHGGRGCPGNGTRREACGPLGACPDVAHWSPWGAWSPCVRPLWGSLSCQEAVGQQRRTRECVGRTPGGPPCPTDEAGGTIQIHACYNIQHCLLDGNWSDWSPWSFCTPPCGASPTRSRWRECQPVLPDYPLLVTPVGSSAPSRVQFWGSPRPRCPPLEGQRLRLEETEPCRGGQPCPEPHEE